MWMGLSGSISCARAYDWRTFVTIEERQNVRRRLKQAYLKVFQFDERNPRKSFDQLLQTSSAIEEELLYASAPGKLDYLKSGYEHSMRLKKKKHALFPPDTNTVAATAALPSAKRPKHNKDTGSAE